MLRSLGRKLGQWVVYFSFSKLGELCGLSSRLPTSFPSFAGTPSGNLSLFTQT